MRVQSPVRRTGFTLVEMMVATALILFIMAIIGQMLGHGTKTFTQMRTAAALSERNRTGINLLRKDLWADHFEGPYGTAGGPHLVDQRLDLPGYRPPFRGYFELQQQTRSLYEPGGIYKPFGTQFPPASPATPRPYTDAEGLFSTRSATHRMRFTVRLPDGPATELFCAQFHPFFTADPRVNAFPNSSGVMYSRWSDVRYMLFAQAGDTTGGTNPQQLHTLIRNLRLMPPRDVDYSMDQASATTLITQCQRYADVVQPYVVGPDQNNAGRFIVRLPGPEAINRSEVSRINFSGAPSGDNIVLTDVISFEIKPAWINNPTFEALRPGSSPPPDGMAQDNTDEPFADLPPSVLNTSPPYSTQGIFDTWGIMPNVNDGVDWDVPDASNGFLVTPTPPPLPAPQTSALHPPLRINVRALQIKMRIWDPKAEQARQVTIVNDV